MGLYGEEATDTQLELFNGNCNRGIIGEFTTLNSQFLSFGVTAIN